MTPKEKAIQLVAKYKSQSFGITTNFQHFKQCALIAVDEILKSYPHTFDLDKEYLNDKSEIFILKNTRPDITWWLEVKQEIEKL